MHVQMKTSYDDDIRLVRHRATLLWYGLLALGLLPRARRRRAD